MASSAVLSVDEFVAEYGAHVEAQSAAMFVGAGLSRLSGYPDWAALVKPYGEALDVELEDFPLLVQYYEDSTAGGADQVRRDIIAMVRDTQATPSEAHKGLLGLPIPEIWTTNYDQLIERAASDLSIDAQVFAEDEDFVTTRAVVKRIYKMHGSVEPDRVTQDLVISRDDFDRYPSRHPRFWQLMHASFLTRTFLFLGFSLTDPNMSEILRLARLYTPSVQRPHYAVMRHVTDARSRLAELRRRDLARAGVRVVEIAEPEDVVTVIARLGARCRPPRAYLSGSVAASAPEADWTSAFSQEFARLLAIDGDVRLVTGGEIGAQIGYEMCRQRHEAGTYHPDDFVVIRRVRDETLTPPSLRWGSVVFDGEAAEPLRSAAFERVRALIALGGSDRTRAEIVQARRLGMGVIAIGATGGAARERWLADRETLDAYRLGERPVDRGSMAALGGNDPHAAAVAALALSRQALFLS